MYRIKADGMEALTERWTGHLLWSMGMRKECVEVLHSVVGCRSNDDDNDADEYGDCDNDTEYSGSAADKILRTPRSIC